MDMAEQSSVKWYTIKIDSEVFYMLQRHAQPLVDTANDVLRRILLKVPQPPLRTPKKSTPRPDYEAPLVDSATFVQFILQDRFGDGFHRFGRYQYMFESSDQIVYFQNYNQKTDLLWYRVTKKPRKDLTSSSKQAWLCLTNPAERYAYIIPIADIEERAESSGWSRDEFEIHIIPRESRWVEIDWNISQYRHDLPQPK